MKKLLALLFVAATSAAQAQPVAVDCSTGGQMCATESTVLQINDGVLLVNQALEQANLGLEVVSETLTTMQEELVKLNETSESIDTSTTRVQTNVRRLRELSDRHSVGVDDLPDVLDEEGVVVESGAGRGDGLPEGDIRGGGVDNLDDFQDIPIDAGAAGSQAPTPGSGISVSGNAPDQERLLRSLFVAYRTAQGVFHRTMTAEQQFLHYQPQYGEALRAQVADLRVQLGAAATEEERDAIAQIPNLALHGVLAERNSIALHQAMGQAMRMLRANHHPSALESEEAFVQALLDRTGTATGQMQLMQMSNHLLGTLARGLQKARDLTAQQASSQIAWIQYSVARDERARVQQEEKEAVAVDAQFTGNESVLRAVDGNRRCTDEGGADGWLLSRTGERVARVPTPGQSFIACRNNGAP